MQGERVAGMDSLRKQSLAKVFSGALGSLGACRKYVLSTHSVGLFETVGIRH